MKKPLDIRPESDAVRKERSGNRVGALPVMVLFLFLAAILSYLFFFKPQSTAAPEGKIEIFVNSPLPLSPGVPAKVNAFSSCGSFELFLDGSKVGQGEPSVNFALMPTVGRHSLEAKNSRCSASLQFEVLQKECEDEQEEACVQGACSGRKTCVNGFFTPCELPRKICVPGERVGCSTDACRFGYTTCNQCGDAFGPCLPRENVSSPASCSTGTCT